MMFYDFPLFFLKSAAPAALRHLRHAGRQAQSPCGPDLPRRRRPFRLFFCRAIWSTSTSLPTSSPTPTVSAASSTPQQMTVSGRWFLHFASYFNGFTQMPAVIGLLRALPRPWPPPWPSLCWASAAVPLSALSGALMAAFPAVGYTFLYLFTASAYCFAIFFGGPLRLPGQKGPVALAGRLSAPGLLHGHLSGLCDGGHRPVPAGHFPGDPGPVRLLLRHPCAWGCG